MRVHIVNVRDAEKYHYITTQGELFTNHNDLEHHVEDLIATGVKLIPSLDMAVPLVVGDAILLAFPQTFDPESKDNEKPKEHVYRVFGRFFDRPRFSAVHDSWGIPSVTLFVHSMTDETNTNWGDEGDEAGAEGGL